jgi:O-antigen ligase
MPPRTDRARVAVPPVDRGAADKATVASAPKAATRREMGAAAILATIFGCLLVGHLAIAAYFPSVAVNAVGVVVVALIIGRVLFVKNDMYSALLIIFFCSQFNFANNQGGLFNLVAFLLLAIYLAVKPGIRETTRGTDTTIMSLLIILSASNLLGLILRNPMPLFIKCLEIAAFSGFMLAFHFASSLRLTKARLRVFLIVASVMAAYNFAISMNQRYSVIQLDTPLLGLTEDLFYATTNAFGVFGSASSSGQYTMLLLALILPLLAASASRTALKLSPISFVPVVVICGLTLILSNMRAASLEAVLVVIIYTVMFSLRHRRHFRNSKYLNMASAALIVVLATVGVWFNLDNIERELQQVEVQGVESVESGKAINRFGPWQFGMDRLAREGFIVGYGHGTAESNQIAWGIIATRAAGRYSTGGHLHNLYLALPMMYGWSGALAYVLLHLVVFFRLLGAVRRYPFSILSNIACLGFLMSLGFFLIDEVKSGNAVQSINYPMIMWIWLGLGLAAWRTLKAEVAEAARSRKPGDGAGGGPGEEPGAEGGVEPHRGVRPVRNNGRS